MLQGGKIVALHTTTQSYYAYGKKRGGGAPITDHRFTGQKLDGTGLMYYQARYYDPAVGQFISPDTLVPDATNVLDYNRFMYVRGNPINANDPSGHYSNEEIMQHFGCDSWGCVESHFQEGGSHAGLWSWLKTLREAQDGDYVTSTFSGFYTLSGNFSRSGSTININLLHMFAPYKVIDYDGLSVSSDIAAWWATQGRYGSDYSLNGISASSVCDTWDCPAIALDLASLGTSVAQTGAVACTATGVGAPLCGPSAAALTAADMTISGTSVAYETYKYANGNTTSFDLSVELADSAAKPMFKAVGAGASATPGVGIGYDLIMLAYDLVIDPFVTTPGTLKGAR